MHNPIPLSVRIRSFFARDKRAFWWDHFTDEEKQLRRMDAWQLATVIHEESIRQTAPEKRIVAEHMLNVRLAQIQATASWGSGVLCFVGAIIGAAMSVALTSVLQSPKEVKCNPERTSEKQAVSALVQKQPEPIARPPENLPSTQIIKVTPSTQNDVNRPQYRQNAR
jgi:hypothetical protein